jgi:hypothetical protein
MAQADSADTTTLPALRPGNSAAHKLFHMPTGLSTERPPVDRSALMRRAHEIARKFRPHVASYREALQYGRKVAASRTATHRCGVFAPVARGPPSGAGARRRAVPKAGPRQCAS